MAEHAEVLLEGGELGCASLEPLPAGISFGSFREFSLNRQRGYKKE